MHGAKDFDPRRHSATTARSAPAGEFHRAIGNVTDSLAEGLTSYPEQSFDDRNHFSTAFNDQALFFQGAFALHESEQLDDEIYFAYFDWLVSLVSTPGGTSWWETVGRPIYFNRMVRAVDARLAEGDFHDVRTLDMFRIDD